MVDITDEQRSRWEQGTCSDAHRFLGARKSEDSFDFQLWAPHARQVHVVGDFNDWDARKHAMQNVPELGFWQCAISEAKLGQHYKYAITDVEGATVLKSDPFAYYGQHQAHHASILYDFPDYNWNDEKWMNERATRQQDHKPLSIYEVHPGSWRHNKQGQPLSYPSLAEQLVPYVVEMGFTHIELMPIMEHPYTPSWGYQVSGYFAPTSRYGRPEDFMAFVDACHRNNIGVIMDWVPGHFPTDEHGLAFFDGQPLYEHADKRRRNHPDWGTHNFDFSKAGVRNFLLSNAHFWAEKYHIDCFRVDAVASMLYLDYSKKKGDWLPNKSGGKENLDAVSFLQDFNKLMTTEFPGLLTIAEESTAWPGVTAPVKEGGLDFNYKWNMGWMNDSLHYFSQSPEQRKKESHSITFPRTFAFSEHFVLPFSHDEVVHLKKPLLEKMPGSTDDKFAQLRLLLLYMIACPGKKLLFMGSEIAERQEWSESRSLNWSLLNRSRHKQFQKYTKTLLHFYRNQPVLYTSDHKEDTFEWLDLERKEDAIFSFKRKIAEGPSLNFIFNFSGETIDGYRVPFTATTQQKILIDSRMPGGTTPSHQADMTSLRLTPYQGVILQPL